jgi:hypothetical protein
LVDGAALAASDRVGWLQSLTFGPDLGKLEVTFLLLSMPGAGG